MLNRYLEPAGSIGNLIRVYGSLDTSMSLLHDFSKDALRGFAVSHTKTHHGKALAPLQQHC